MRWSEVIAAEVERTEFELFKLDQVLKQKKEVICCEAVV